MKNNRPTKNQWYMNFAEVAATMSHDSQTKVGCVLVKDDGSGSIVGQGFNGFVRGAPDLDLPKSGPEKYPFFIHSEQNLLFHCCRQGISTANTVLYCTLSPCKNCTRYLYQAGVSRIIVKTIYKDFNEVLSLPDLKVETSSTPEGFLELIYKQKV